MTRAGFATAVAMKRLAHPGIVRVVDVATDGDDVWVAMEVAGGGSLAEHLRDAGAPPLNDAVHIATRVCDALSYAHTHGVLHLDVKPANVLFASDGAVLLADFGGDTRGTAGFAAPEVEHGDATVDERADVYGVGALLAAMLGPGPSPLARVVARAMASNPADRYPSVDELAAALHDETEPVVPEMPSDSATRPFGPRPPRPMPAAERKRRRWRVRVVVASASLVLLGALAAAANSAWGERREHGACPDAATSHITTLESATGEVLWRDVDGDGCDDPLVRTGNVLEWNGLRFSVGEPGDVVLIGDWDCDGVATAAAWRKADGVAFVFDGWAGAGEELPAARRVSLRPGGGPPTPCRG